MEDILLVSEELQGEKESVATGKGRVVNMMSTISTSTEKPASDEMTPEELGSSR